MSGLLFGAGRDDARLRSIDKTPFGCPKGHLRAGGKTEFAHDVLQVYFCCSFGDYQSLSNCAISEAIRDQRRYFAFARGERVDSNS